MPPTPLWVVTVYLISSRASPYPRVTKNHGAHCPATWHELLKVGTRVGGRLCFYTSGNRGRLPCCSGHRVPNKDSPHTPLHLEPHCFPEAISECAVGCSDISW